MFGGAASSQLAAPDSAAWEQLLSHRTGTASFEEPLWAQHSEPVAEPESSNLSQAAAASSKEVAPAQHSEPSDVNWVRDPLRRTGLRPDCQSTWIRAVSLVLTECSLRRARRRVSLTQRCDVPCDPAQLPQTCYILVFSMYLPPPCMRRQPFEYWHVPAGHRCPPCCFMQPYALWFRAFRATACYEALFTETGDGP